VSPSEPEELPPVEKKKSEGAFVAPKFTPLQAV
jgi:hypothetical protein